MREGYNIPPRERNNPLHGWGFSMKKLFGHIGGFLGSTLALLFFLEVLFHFIGAPGASRHIEKVLIEAHLGSRKPSGEFRIFTYGESTMHGSHYGPVSNPARWLEAYLKDFLPDHKIVVVNFARMGSSSEFAYGSFRDTLTYKPDLAIFYLGHNDFLRGNRKDHVQAERRMIRYQLRNFIRKSWFFSTGAKWVVSWRMKLKKEKPEVALESDVIEMPPLGIGTQNATPSHEPFYWENLEFFRENILAILKLARRKGVKALFYKPVSNIKDFSPFHSVHMRPLTAEELARWEKYFEEGKKKLEAGNWEEARPVLGQAYALDPTYAELCFRLGRGYFEAGELVKARKFLEEARDRDAIIFRATTDVVSVLEKLGREEGLNLLDTEKVILPEALGGIPGEPVIEDNVHLSLRGHSLVGRFTAREIANQNWIAPKEAWRFERERAYGEIARDLGIDEELLFSAYLQMVNYFGSRFDNRIRYAEKALELKPDHPRALRYLAWTCWLKGEKDRAMSVYRRLGGVDPEALREVLRLQPEIARAVNG